MCAPIIMYHTAQPHWQSIFRLLEWTPTDCGTSMQNPSWSWNSRPAFFPLQGCHRVCTSNLHVLEEGLLMYPCGVTLGILPLLYKPSGLCGSGVSILVTNSNVLSVGLQGRRVFGFRIASPLYVDDAVLLVSSDRDYQLALEQFAVGWETVWDGRQAMVLCWKTTLSGLGVSCFPKRRP